MNWILLTNVHAINLSCFCHIWVHSCPNGYVLMGEMTHNGEEIVLSQYFEDETECRHYLFDLVNNLG